MRPFATALMITMALRALAAAEPNHCEIAVAGDSTVNIRADAPRDPTQGKLAASTDYWLSDAQLRMALEVMQGIGSKLTPAEKQRKVDEAMKKDPRFMVLTINCLSDEGGLILSPASGTKYADIPMRPGSYPIVPTGRPRPGEFTVMFHLSTKGKRESFPVKEPGKLVVTRFDRRGIAGTFTFKAEQRGKPEPGGKPRTIAVTGGFNYGCTGDICQK
jgi:hypothetical protein